MSTTSKARTVFARRIVSATAFVAALVAAQTAHAENPVQGFYWTGLSGSTSEFNDTQCWYCVKSWDEKLYTRDVEFSGKKIHVIGL